LLGLLGCNQEPAGKPASEASAAPSSPAAASAPIAAAPSAPALPPLSSAWPAQARPKEGWVEAKDPAGTKHKPVVVLRESGMVVRSSQPVLTIYEDGLVLRRDSERTKESKLVSPYITEASMRMGQMPAADVERLVDEIVATGIGALWPKVEVAAGPGQAATDRPFVHILVRKGPLWKVTSAHGLTHEDGEPKSPDGRSPRGVPEAFLASYRKLLAIEPPDPKAWQPDEVRATLTDASDPAKKTARSFETVDWDKDLPEPGSGSGSREAPTLAGKDAKAILKFSRELGSDWEVTNKRIGRRLVSRDGKTWRLDVEGIVPGFASIEAAVGAVQ
jgi:hypothetical protein